MALNTWWDGDGHQRYWMEIATTGSMGERLIAPKIPEATWSYELVREVREGDRILHWQSDGGARGLVGWSVATGAPEVTPEYTWQPRGTAGRVAGPRTTEGWVVPLGGLNRFARPLAAEQLQDLREPVLAVNAVLERTHGKPTYFPFYLYGGRELRAQQGYLVKFPVELFDVLANIGEAKTEGPAPTDAEVVPEDNERPKRRVPRGKLTRVQDPQLRLALENYAVDRAIRHYVEELGATEVKKLGKPYDVSLWLAGARRHVEVKGSSLLIDTVELTINEVTHSREYQPTDLVVVDAIEWTRVGSEIITSGGRLRMWADWKPEDDSLSPRKFAYSLP